MWDNITGGTCGVGGGEPVMFIRVRNTLTFSLVLKITSPPPKPLARNIFLYFGGFPNIDIFRYNNCRVGSATGWGQQGDRVMGVTTGWLLMEGDSRGDRRVIGSDRDNSPPPHCDPAVTFLWATLWPLPPNHLYQENKMYGAIGLQRYKIGSASLKLVTCGPQLVAILFPVYLNN